MKKYHYLNVCVSTKLVQMSKPFVKMSIITTLMLASYVPFLDNANKYYHERFGFSIMHAGRIITVGYIVAGIFNLLFSYFLTCYWQNK